ncbi:hypothetical protein [Spirosoma pollinicola]|uniref:Uncharacterized protein n=1 Tax=Spirosoma pollinicola TaxID=2057025 RepID=A0A2K8YT39_9BACT|nr:hypothetical protein [Spirosoma pollinicola]AUD00787.1 hypothetical protein CWM47_02520 [Spirosoma pollinicola]
MATEKQTNKARKMLEAIHGPALSEAESGQVTDVMSARFAREVEQQQTQQKKFREITRPLSEALARTYAELTDKMRAELEASFSKIPPVKPPDTPTFDSALLPGSIIAIFAPPYDFGVQHGGQEASGRADIGQIHVRSQEIGAGAISANAQIGKWFWPITNGIVRFRTVVDYSFSWWDKSLFYTAHNHGFVGVFVFEQTNSVNRLILDNRVQLWNDGTGWVEGHNGSGSGFHEVFDLPFFARQGSAYFLGVWCGCSVDADSGFGGFSAASAEFTGNVPLIVVKTQ